jgi:hypothetical protein
MKLLRKTIRRLIIESKGYGAKIGPLLNSDDVDTVRHALTIGEAAEVIEIVSNKRTGMGTDIHVKILDPDVAEWFKNNGKSKVIKGDRYVDPRTNGTITPLKFSLNFYKGELYYGFIDPVDLDKLHKLAQDRMNRAPWVRGGKRGY